MSRKSIVAVVYGIDAASTDAYVWRLAQETYTECQYGPEGDEREDRPLPGGKKSLIAPHSRRSHSG